MQIADLLQYTIDQKASDLHLIVGYPATVRVNGVLLPIDDHRLTASEVVSLYTPLLTEDHIKAFDQNKEIDFGYSYADGRFRINLYFQGGSPAVALRLIPLHIRTIEDLSLPVICHSFAQLRQGFILVTGPTGHGKSTTIASIIEEINIKYGGHIVTIEDPVEYVFSKGKALVSQRELGLDTHSWANALRSVLREDPNIVLVGEMRDFETIGAAITVAETGHLVFATLHTNSAAQSIDRIVDVFPETQQAQIRLQLSNSLEAVISQRLIPGLNEGRVPSTEVLIATPAVRSIVREGKTHLIDNVIQTSADLGMMTMDMSLASLVKSGKISRDTAMEYASSSDDVNRLIGKF